MKGILARKEVQVMRDEEMIFLGMNRSPRAADEYGENDPLVKRDK